MTIDKRGLAMQAFVLSGGGNRGALQVGAMEILLEAGIQPDMILGCSVGAFNGAFLAKDPTLSGIQHLKEVYEHIDFSDVFSGGGMDILMRLISGEKSLFHNEPLLNLLEDEFESMGFGDLSIPCYVIATDIDSAALRVFGDDAEDKVVDGLMGSAAITPLYPPWEVNGRFYADGGLKAMLPLHAAVERGATRIIALDLETQLKSPEERKTVVDMMLHSINLLLQSQVEWNKACVEEHLMADLQVINLFNDEYIRFDDMTHVSSMIAQGQKLAREFLQSAKSKRLTP
jgi:NTE family protein